MTNFNYESHRILMQHNIVQYFRSNNCIVIDGKYEDKYSKFKFVCCCGNIHEMHSNNFKKGKRCGYCNRKTYSEDLDQRREALFNLMSSIVFTHSLEFQCECGVTDYLPHVYDSRVFTNYICPKCDTRNTRNSSEYNMWKRKVLSTYNSTCQKCNSLDKPHVHHIESRLSNPELAHEISNGIVLCFDCHMELHKAFGSQTNRQNLTNFLSF